MGAECRCTSWLEDREVAIQQSLVPKIRWGMERTPFKDRKCLSTFIDPGKVQRRSRRWWQGWALGAGLGALLQAEREMGGRGKMCCCGGILEGDGVHPFGSTGTGSGFCL